MLKAFNKLVIGATIFLICQFCELLHDRASLITTLDDLIQQLRNDEEVVNFFAKKILNLALLLLLNLELIFFYFRDFSLILSCYFLNF